MNNVAESKTPVSVLQELCTKWGIVPKYDLISQNGPVHDPLFEYQVSAGEHATTAKGSSKKKAKHNAAESLISVIKSAQNGLTNSVVTYNAPETECDGDYANSCGGSLEKLQDRNSIGELQELTQKRRWPPPVYECTSECGPAHSREYIFTVRLLNLTVKGSGASKKIAKKNAATALIQSIESFGCSLNTQVDSEVVVAHDLPDTELIEAVQELKLGEKKLSVLNPQASQKINQFYMMLKSKTEKTLASLQGLTLNVPSTNYCQLLEEISEEQGFTTTYVNLNEQTFDDKYQCLVQLSLLPVAVCRGVGCSIEDAQLDAAHNALQYLKIMTRKT